METQIPLEKLGPPGIGGELIIVHTFAGDTRSDEDRRKDPTKRPFTVRARLSKQAQADDGVTSVVSSDFGGSYFLAHPDSVVTELHSSAGPFKIYHNKNREFSTVEFSCVAASVSEARGQFLTGVMPFFDYLCFTASVPLHVPLVVCEDVQNQVIEFAYVTPYPKTTINPHEGQFITALVPMYALYREARNASSPFYAFLCYFKILEGIYRHIRAQTFKLAREKCVLIATREEKVPSGSNINAGFAGKPIGPLFESRFQKIFRDRVAHYILDSSTPLNVSDDAATTEFRDELFLIEQCARVVLSVQAEYCKSVA